MRGLAGGLAAAAVVVTAVGLAVSGPAPRSAAPVRVGDRLMLLGPVSARREVTFDLVLAEPGQRRADAALAAIEDPGSPDFGRAISPRRYGERFGLPAPALTRAEGWLRRTGIRVLRAYPQRTELRVRASAGTVQRVFGVRLRLARSSDGGRGLVLVRGRPAIPLALRGSVQALTGLDQTSRIVAHDVPLTGLDPAQAAIAYDIEPLHRAGYDGQGQTIAIVSFSTYDPSDPAAFAREHHLRGPAPRVIAVDGGTTDSSNSLEANLDIDLVRAIAPAAQILVYEADRTSGTYGDVLDTIVKQHRAQIISSSWGECEPATPPGEHAAVAAALRAAVHVNVTTFVASGDQGAYDCQQSNPVDDRLAVDWPASSADAVAVGGTRLLLGDGSRYLGETAWDDQLYAEGSGGGISRFDPRPAWQAGAGVIDRWSDGRRQVPDVSADADPGTSWAFFAEGGNATESGTSAAAPFWAGVAALVAQYAAAHHAGGLPYLNPILYALARRRWRRPPFHDITRGYNRFYPAARGWDPATGLGSPDAFNLARDIVAYVRAGRARRGLVGGAGRRRPQRPATPRAHTRGPIRIAASGR